ncbi:MAG TPA: hypothetical protein VKX46_17105 [Ktedonobacteraceae bacterium]|jgi:hypothetical protein|nr:hypothetical protein [Ktedonobacteraceae bacterium]
MSINTSPYPVPTATHLLRQQYLLAFASQQEIMHYVKTRVADEGKNHLEEVLDKWRKLQPQVEQLIQNEQNYPDTIQRTAIPEQYQPRLENYISDPLFQQSFSGFPISIEIVEIDKLVAAQRTVNLDHIERLIASSPSTPTFDDLLTLCVSPRQDIDVIPHLEVAPNQHIFTSQNPGLRLLGSFVKKLTDEDSLMSSSLGGLPATAIITYIGYGCPTMNAFRVNNRLILNNGFHRVYALRSMGVTELPMVIQNINNPQLELPPTIADLPTNYLINASRPALVKDFFEPEFAITLQVHELVKLVGVVINSAQHGVPL